MSKEKLQKNYVSPLDQFLNQFDREHPALSQSQLKEKNKYKRIYQLRDDPVVQVISKLPDDF